MIQLNRNDPEDTAINFLETYLPRLNSELYDDLFYDLVQLIKDERDWYEINE